MRDGLKQHAHRREMKIGFIGVVMNTLVFL